ncbi:MAG: hypothetical protein IMF18_08940 [Proteobacteria bacterium]|nr:hypothetical protein [Pseudomonadota bacterium]
MKRRLYSIRGIVSKVSDDFEKSDLFMTAVRQTNRIGIKAPRLKPAQAVRTKPESLG